MPIDQAQELNKCLVKGFGGHQKSTKITKNPSAIRKWILPGSEQANLVRKLKFSTDQMSVKSIHILKKGIRHRTLSKNRSLLWDKRKKKWAIQFLKIVLNCWSRTCAMLLMSL